MSQSSGAFPQIAHKFGVFSKNLHLTLLISRKYRASFVKLHGLRVDFNEVRGVFCESNIHKVQGLFRKLHINLGCFQKFVSYVVAFAML
jgi:hypothetical protein